MLPKFDVMRMVMSNNNRVKIVSIDSDTYIYAVGDVHGCIDEMKEIVNKCKNHAISNNKTFYIIFLGDIIDRGPAFFEIFEYLIEEPSCMSILGNHELNFYLEALGVKECRSKARKDNHVLFEQMTKIKQDLILDYIGNMLNGIIFNTEEPCENGFQDFILTHSPIRSIEYAVDREVDFDITYMMNGPQCSMRSEPINFEQLDKVYNNIMMVHGHQSWNFKSIPEQYDEQSMSPNRVINIDSGCVYGDTLTAICLNTNDCVEVKARKVYSERH